MLANCTTHMVDISTKYYEKSCVCVSSIWIIYVSALLEYFIVWLGFILNLCSSSSRIENSRVWSMYSLKIIANHLYPAGPVTRIENIARHLEQFNGKCATYD